jgi:hypothetical protein
MKIKTLEERAKEFAYREDTANIKDRIYQDGLYFGFIEGVNSNYIKAKNISENIDLLNRIFQYSLDEKNDVLDIINAEITALYFKSLGLFISEETALKKIE